MFDRHYKTMERKASICSIITHVSQRHAQVCNDSRGVHGLLCIIHLLLGDQCR